MKNKVWIITKYYYISQEGSETEILKVFSDFDTAKRFFEEETKFLQNEADYKLEKLPDGALSVSGTGGIFGHTYFCFDMKPYELE